MARVPRIASSWTLGMLLLASVGALAGCNAVATAVWIFKDGKTAAAEYPGLNGKKVAVVCRGPMELRFRHEQQFPSQLAKKVGGLLRENLGRKTVIIPQEKIAKVTDEKDWDQFTEVGKEVGAQQVVGIELEQFHFSKGGGVYKATAAVSITVYDLEQDGKEIQLKSMDNIVFPPVSEAVPSTEMTEKVFLEKFVAYLAGNIGKKFYDYDPMLDFASNGLN